MGKDLEALDKQYVWHPFTQMQDWLRNEQLIINKGEGCCLFDINGKKYLDGVSSLWTIVHGHNHPKINQAIEKQLKKISHSTFLGLSHEPAILLAEKLIKIAPKGLKKVFYSDDGSTSVEIALKMAFQYWKQVGTRHKASGTEKKAVGRKPLAVSQKNKFIFLENSYHGDTIGSVSVGGIDLFHKLYKPLLFKSFKTMMGDLIGLEQLMRNHHQEIAAMIVEPMIQGASGMLLQPKGYLTEVRRLCTKYHILLILDEVATGFGRTGKMFASEHEKVSPDIMCIAKGLTGGYLPVAATLTTNEVYNAFLGDPSENKTFFHGHTFTANPLGCAAAIANLEIFEKEKTLKSLQPKIKLLKELLTPIGKMPQVKEVRQLGFMVGIELKPKGERLGHRVIMEARKRGAILRPLGDVVVLMPPLSISEEELKELIRITKESIKVF